MLGAIRGKLRKVLFGTSIPTSVSEEVRSVTDNGYYPLFCRRAALQDRLFASFKRHPYYTSVLEHVTAAEGQQYLNIVQKAGQIPIDKATKSLFYANDSIGRPRMRAYTDIGKISSTNLRYLKVCSDLRQHFGDISGFRIAEIGVGYGGQTLFTDKLLGAAHFTLFDLHPVLMLVERYLESFVLNASYRLCTLNQFAKESASFDLVVSNYAFSELPVPLQRIYVERVLSCSRRGYLTMNASHDKQYMLFSELQNYIPKLQRYSEEPLTALRTT